MRHAPVALLAATLVAALLAAPGAARAADVDLMPWVTQSTTLNLVPKDALDATTGSPTLLRGGLVTTRVHFGYRNGGTESIAGVRTRLLLDGSPLGDELRGGLAPLQAVETVSSAMHNVRGGRHTLTMQLDPLGALLETNEANNEYSTQWAWEPGVMVLDSAYVRNGVPNPTAGSASLNAPAPFVNCDGLRSPDFQTVENDGFWGAVAICPASVGNNLDLALFAASTSVTGAFATPLEQSALGAGLTEVVLIDTDPGGGQGGLPGRRDLGVVLSAGPTSQSYTAFATRSEYINVLPYDSGLRTLGPGQTMALFEYYHGPPNVQIVLDNHTGGVDLNLAMVRRLPGQGGYYTLQDMIANGLSSTSGVLGGDEVIQTPFNLPNDFFAVLVWKNSAASLGTSVQYSLRTSVSGVGVESAPPPAASGFLGASPNPVRSRTALSFELARESRVELTVHDLGGRRVATVASGVYGAGRHAVEWNGRGADGRELPGGLYFARFEGGGVTVTRKVTVVR